MFESIANAMGPSTEDRGSLANALKTVVYNPEEFEKEQCCICMYDFKDSKDDGIVKLKCGHIFHGDCLKGNITMGTANAMRCPMCRTEIDQEDQDRMSAKMQ